MTTEDMPTMAWSVISYACLTGWTQYTARDHECPPSRRSACGPGAARLGNRSPRGCRGTTRQRCPTVVSLWPERGRLDYSSCLSHVDHCKHTQYGNHFASFLLEFGDLHKIISDVRYLGEKNSMADTDTEGLPLWILVYFLYSVCVFCFVSGWCNCY